LQQKQAKVSVLSLVVSDCMTDTLILVYLNLNKILAAYHGDVKGLPKRGVPWNPLDPCLIIDITEER